MSLIGPFGANLGFSSSSELSLEIKNFVAVFIVKFLQDKLKYRKRLAEISAFSGSRVTKSQVY